MGKSRTHWLLTALIFFLILIGCAASYIEQKPLKAYESPTQKQAIIDNDTRGKININTADKELLKSLDGIDKVKSNAIIEYRKEHGDFISIEELMNVTGIGTKTYIKIKDKICV